MKLLMIAPWLAMPILVATATAQTTPSTPDDIDRQLSAATPGTTTTPDDGAVTVGAIAPVPCLIGCTAKVVQGRALATSRPVTGYTRSHQPRMSDAGMAEATATTRPAPTGVDMALTFRNGSDQLDPVALPEVDKYAIVLGRDRYAGRRFVIEGHTNSVGSSSANLDLSRRRAATVVEYLARHGVDRSRLEPRGMGAGDPIPGKAGSDPANRRVEIKPM